MPKSFKIIAKLAIWLNRNSRAEREREHAERMWLEVERIHAIREEENPAVLEIPWIEEPERLDAIIEEAETLGSDTDSEFLG